MIRKFGFVVFLAIFAITEAQEIKNEPFAFRKGQKIARTSSVEFNVKTTLKFAGQLVEKYDQEVLESDKRLETILETNGSTITKLRVFYEQSSNSIRTTDSDGIERSSSKKKAPEVTVNGKTYIVTVQGEDLDVTDANGKMVPLREQEIVKADYDDLANPQSFRDLFKGKTLEAGQQIKVPREIARDFLKNRSAKIESFYLTYKGSRKFSGTDVEAFDTRLKMSAAADENTSMKMDLTGEILVHSLHGWAASTSLQGPMRITGTDQIGSRLLLVDGIGIITITETVKVQ